MAPKVRRTSRMASVGRQFRIDAENGQELLPGLPDQIVLQIIAPKLSWKACKVLQTVCRGWRQAIRSRSVYDARALAKSTEAFLVVVGADGWNTFRIILTLYSCKDGTSLRLPPIPDTNVTAFDCICLDGKVYLWVAAYPRNPTWRKTYVLDLGGGGGNWTRRKRRKYPHNFFGHGILDGKIYRFSGISHSNDGILETRTACGSDCAQQSIEFKVETLPQMEVYNPVEDVWSIASPAPFRKAKELDTDLERHLASFSEQEREQLQADCAEVFLTDGRYDPYFSEWRQRQSVWCSTSSTIGDRSQDEMTTQVYYKNERYLKVQQQGFSYCRITEDFFLFQGKLLKSVTVFGRARDRSANVLVYDTRMNTWENWKSLSANFYSLDETRRRRNFYREFVAVGNVIWAIVRTARRMSSSKFSLMRSPALLSEDIDRSFKWIDAGFPLIEGQRSMLRPIYL